MQGVHRKKVVDRGRGGEGAGMVNIWGEGIDEVAWEMMKGGTEE